jgi:hypothetical protein
MGTKAPPYISTSQMHLEVLSRGAFARKHLLARKHPESTSRYPQTHLWVRFWVLFTPKAPKRKHQFARKHHEKHLGAAGACPRTAIQRTVRATTSCIEGVPGAPTTWVLFFVGVFGDERGERKEGVTVNAQTDLPTATKAPFLKSRRKHLQVLLWQVLFSKPGAVHTLR